MEAISGPPVSYSPLSNFGNVLRSEFTKLRSVRSTYWTLFAAVVFTVGLAALGAIVVSSNYAHFSHREQANFNPTQLSLSGVNLAQIAVGVLGVLVITSEYGTGMIRATLGAVPQRRTMLAAKATVFAVTALVVGILSAFVAYFVGQAILGQQLQSSIGDSHVLRAVVGAGLYLAVLGLFAMGLGAIIRVSAGAISALFGILFVLPIVSAVALPQSWQDTINPYLPFDAGRQIYSVKHDGTSLMAWTGFGVFCIYAAVALLIAAFLINRRDA